MSRKPESPRNWAVSRCAVLKLLGLGASALYLPGLAGCGPSDKDESKAKRAGAGTRPAEPGIEGISPIDRMIPDPAPRKFSGDDPARMHRILWDKPGYVSSKGGLPEPSEKVPLVIVGGGLSGLTSAWLLRKHRPVILEGARRFGGNSRGESWQGVDYSIGAAFFVKPDEGSRLEGLFKELKLAEICRERPVEDPVAMQGRRYRGFWEGETDPANKQQFVKAARHFRDVLEQKNGKIGPSCAQLISNGT